MIDPVRFSGTTEEIQRLIDCRRQRKTSRKASKVVPASQVPLPRHRTGERFLKGPVPISWLIAALAISGKSAHLALALWWLSRSQTVESREIDSACLARLQSPRPDSNASAPSVRIEGPDPGRSKEGPPPSSHAPGGRE